MEKAENVKSGTVTNNFYETRLASFIQSFFPLFRVSETGEEGEIRRQNLIPAPASFPIWKGIKYWRHVKLCHIINSFKSN